MFTCKSSDGVPRMGASHRKLALMRTLLTSILSILFLALFSACTVAEAPENTPDFPRFVPATIAVTDVPGSCGTNLCCSICALMPVARVIDGDTFVNDQGQRVRVYGINSVERDLQCYDEAKNRFRELAGDAVRIQYGPRLNDRYGRDLYYIYTEDGRSVDELMVRQGMAHAWKVDGQHRDMLAELEAEARQNGAGCLW